MAIRKSVFLSFAAAGVAAWGAASSAVAQSTYRPAPATVPHDVSDELILSPNDVVLGPGETLVPGDPGVGYGAELPVPHAAHPGMLPEHPNLAAPLADLGFGAPCATCEPGHYGIAEALYMKHDEDRSFRTSLITSSDEEFDYEWAGRLTIGRRFDCVNGYEFVYAGPLEWELDGRNLFDDGFGTGDTVTLDERFEAQMNSLEFNRTYFGWDVVKASVGVRAVLYEEDSDFGWTSTSVANPEVGTFEQSVDNFLVGPQLGLELYYPLSSHVFVGSKIKGALFANFADADTDLVDNGIVSGGSEDDVDIAGMFEIGTNLGYRVTDSITATIGYDVWYLTGVATSYDEAPSDFEDLEADEEVLMHGVTAGIQMNY